MSQVGSRFSRFSAREFHYGHCTECELGLVLDPRVDYENLYNEDYYRGLGADPLVIYSGVDIGRDLEFEGLLKTVERVVERREGRWLDWGGGLGSFAKFLRNNGWDAWAFDEGFAGQELAKSGVLLDRNCPGKFDVISLVEVLEHLVDPLPTLLEISGLLAPGGVLIVTTGNFAKAPPLHRWKYSSVPEVHVTFWSPRAWDFALNLAGLKPLGPSKLDPRVTQYKVVKNVPILKRFLVRCSPFWRVGAKVVDRRFGVSEFSMGRKV